MAVTNTAAFGQTPFWMQALVTAAKAAIGTSTQTNTVAFSGIAIGTNGVIITGASASPNNTVTASWVALYYSVDAGTTLRQFAIGTLTAYTAAATLAPTPYAFLHMNGSAIGPTNPVYIPGTGSGSTVALYAGAGVAVADGIVFTLNGSIL